MMFIWSSCLVHPQTSYTLWWARQEIIVSVPHSCHNLLNLPPEYVWCSYEVFVLYIREHHTLSGEQYKNLLLVYLMSLFRSNWLIHLYYQIWLLFKGILSCCIYVYRYTYRCILKIKHISTSHTLQICWKSWNNKIWNIKFVIRF